MEITGSYTFSFDQKAVWDILMNPDAIAKAIPGVQEMIPSRAKATAGVPSPNSASRR
jgi:carbon monoxide dehydrogenase subunit G